MQFRLKAGAGQHVQDGTVYKPGEIIESDHNLAELFSNKFELVGDDGKARKAPKVPAPTTAELGFETDAEADHEAKADAANRSDDDDDDDEPDDEETENSSTGKPLTKRKSKASTVAARRRR